MVVLFPLLKVLSNSAAVEEVAAVEEAAVREKAAVEGVAGVEEEVDSEAEVDGEGAAGVAEGAVEQEVGLAGVADLFHQLIESHLALVLNVSETALLSSEVSPLVEHRLNAQQRGDWKTMEFLETLTTVQESEEEEG